MMDRAGRDLARRVARLRRRGPGERYPARLRAQITAWVRTRRDRGAWWCDVARDLGVPAETLKRWAAPVPNAATACMVAVEVIDAPPPGTVTLVSPTGLRIEGVAIADAITLLRGLA